MAVVNNDKYKFEMFNFFIQLTAESDYTVIERHHSNIHTIPYSYIVARKALYTPIMLTRFARIQFVCLRLLCRLANRIHGRHSYQEWLVNTSNGNFFLCDFPVADGYSFLDRIGLIFFIGQFILKLMSVVQNRRHCL